MHVARKIGSIGTWAVLAVLAAGTPALACDDHKAGGGSGGGQADACCETGAKAPAAHAHGPAAAGQADCCAPDAKPGAAKPGHSHGSAGAAKPGHSHGPAAEADCCATGPGAAAHSHAAPGGEACCAEGAGKGPGHDGGKGHGHDGPGMHGHGHDGPGMHGHGHDGPGMQGHGMGGHGHGRWGMGRGNAWKNMEVRYMPSLVTTTGGLSNQYIVLGGGRQFAKNEWLSLGMASNLAVQLYPAANVGNWVAHYGGILPRVGVNLGTARLDVGVLAGLGGMVRTNNMGTTGTDFLQGKFMWVLEPRVELGYKTEDYGAALVGTYLMTPNMADLGGVGVGVKLTCKKMPSW